MRIMVLFLLYYSFILWHNIMRSQCLMKQSSNLQNKPYQESMVLRIKCFSVAETESGILGIPSQLSYNTII